MSPQALSERELANLRALSRRIDPSDPGAHNNLGVLYYHRGLFGEAVAAFTRALELDPRMEVARENLEAVHRETGWYDRRVTELRDRLSREPALPELHLELGRAYLALRQLPEAEEQFEQLRRLTPGEATALVQLGLTAQTRGDQEDAARWLRLACEADLTSSVTRVAYGQALYNRGLNEEALRVLQEAIRLAPTNPDAHFLLGFVLGDLGRQQEATAATRTALELNPALATAQSNLRIQAPRRTAVAAREVREEAGDGEGMHPHIRLGLAFRKRGYLVEALREYRLALEAGEDATVAAQGIAEVHLLRGEFGRALEQYHALLTQQPGNTRFWNDYGVCLQQAGRVDEARDAYRRAVDLDPTDALAWNNLGVTTAGGDDPGGPIRAFQAALRVRPDLVAAHLNLGLLHFHRKQFQAATEAYREVLAQHPEHPIAWNGIGLILMELRRHGEARNAFGRAVDASPDNAVARYNLGFALSQLGEFDAALRETKRALELDPYYVPQKFALVIDLQFEESVIEVVPTLSADVVAATLDQFVFDPELLDDVFAELAAPAVVEDTSRGTADDPFALAWDYLEKGLWESATAEVNRAIQRGAPSGPASAVLGTIFARRGLYGEALERFRVARAQSPDDPRALLGEAQALLSLERADEALKAADELVRRRPADPDARWVRGRARLLRGETARAKADAEGAVTRGPGRADLILFQGTVLRLAGDHDGAVDAYRAALELDSGLVQGWYELGVVYQLRGAFGDARAAYRRALDLLPTHLDSVLALADLLRRNGRPGDAVDLLVDHLLAEPYALDALVLLGQSLIDDRRFEPAVEALERVLRLDPEHAVARFHAGAAYARLRRFPDAVAAWQLVVRQSPTGPLAAAARANARSAGELAHIFGIVEELA